MSLLKQAPHITLITGNGDAHVIPEQFFLDVIEGRREYEDLQGHKQILPVIIYEWLLSLREEDGTDDSTKH